MSRLDRARDRPDDLTLAAFVLLVIAAGGNAPAIRFVSCRMCELEPFWGAAMRFLIASLILFGVAYAMRVGMPRRRALVGSVLFGTLQFGVGFGLIYWGFVRAPAGLGQILLSLVPLLTFGLALAHKQEIFRWEGLVGAVLSAAGIAVVFQSGLDRGVPLGSMAAMMAGALCWAEAFVVVRAFPRVHPAAQNAIGMGVGTMILLLLALLFNESFDIPDKTETWVAQAYLVLAGSIGVFCLYVFVLSRWNASAASYQMVLIPLVTVPVSAWLLDEEISFSFVGGAVLVLVGVYIGTLKRSPRPGVSEEKNPSPQVRSRI